MNFKRLINNKYLVILLFSILGVLFLNDFFTIREGKDISPEKAQALGKDIKSSIDNKMAAAGVPFQTPDTGDMFKQLTELMETEIARSTEHATTVAVTEAKKNTSPAENTVPPNIIANSFFLGNKFSDVFCNKYTGAQLENKCAELTEDNCNITDCCVYANGTKCMAGDANGPKSTAFLKTDANYYLYKYQCYGNCYVPEITKQENPQKINCNEDLSLVSTTCFNQHVTELNCDGFIIPHNFSGSSASGMTIANNYLDMSESEYGLNWGILKKMITAQVAARPTDCKPNSIRDQFNIKN